MCKRFALGELVLVLAMGLIAAFGFLPSCFAEEMTFSTYYPAPSGVYNQMQTNRLAVGDTNNSGGLDAGDQPDRDGDIRLKPQTGDPTTWPAGTTGQFSYSSVDNALYHYDGFNWVKPGGGGGVTYTYYCLTAVNTFPKCVNSGGTRGYCPVGYQQQADLGQWGTCFTSGGTPYLLPPGGTCGSGSSSVIQGKAYLCSQ